MRLYVDTNVFIDYITQRLPCSLFIRALQYKWTIVISDIVLQEIRGQGYSEQVSQLLQFYDCELVVHISQDFDCAKQYRTHIADALHITIATRTSCDAIITRNKKDFKESSIPVRGPNEKL